MIFYKQILLNKCFPIIGAYSFFLLVLLSFAYIISLLGILRKRSVTFTESILSKSESVIFSLIEPVICLFTDSSVQKYFSLSNQLIFTDWINEKIFFTLKSVDFH